MNLFSDLFTILSNSTASFELLTSFNEPNASTKNSVFVLSLLFISFVLENYYNTLLHILNLIHPY
jgi:hypothetical protein